MILIVCVDDAGGLSFNRRRQSQDRALRARMLEKWGRLWMNAYSARQFDPPPEGLRTAEDFLEQAGPGEVCFLETEDPAAWADRAEGLIVYRWNRKYPAGLYCTIDLSAWKLERREEFAGSSHEKITKEVYKR